MKLHNCFFSLIIIITFNDCFATQILDQINKRNAVLEQIDDFFMKPRGQFVWLREEHERNPGGQWITTYVNPKYDEDDTTYHAQLSTVTVYDPPPVDQEILDEIHTKIQSIEGIKISVQKLSIDGAHTHQKFNLNDIWIGKYLTPQKEVAEIYFVQTDQPALQSGGK